MGAQQTYEWAVRYPDFVKRAAPIAGTAKNTEHDFVFTDTLSEAITSDPGFNGGNYGSPADVAAGLKRQAKLWTVMGWSTDFFREGRHKALGFDSVQAFVDNFMTGYFAPMDPNDLSLLITSIADSPERITVANDSAAGLRRELRRLPPEQARAVAMAGIYGMTARQVAEAEGVPVGTAKTRIRYGLQKLRAALLPEDADDE
jgi:homoserine acetyltransferase